MQAENHTSKAPHVTRTKHVKVPYASSLEIKMAVYTIPRIAFLLLLQQGSQQRKQFQVSTSHFTAILRPSQNFKTLRFQLILWTLELYALHWGAKIKNTISIQDNFPILFLINNPSIKFDYLYFNTMRDPPASSNNSIPKRFAIKSFPNHCSSTKNLLLLWTYDRFNLLAVLFFDPMEMLFCDFGCKK